jgi:hypothetical protein
VAQGNENVYTLPVSNCRSSYHVERSCFHDEAGTPELRAAFMAEAEAAHRPASQVFRELMREFVQRQREAQEYDEFLRSKVEAGRASMRAGHGRSNDKVEAVFAAKRNQVVGKK